MSPQPNNLPELPPRSPHHHKGDFGRALLVGGSRGMSGAIALAGMATLRAGAGLVTLAVADRCLETVAGFDPCYMTVPLPCDDRGTLAAAAQPPLEDLMTRSTAVACGPGLGRGEDLTLLVRRLYASVGQPMVVDADGLNALAGDERALASPGGPRVITPHPGEFRRLVAGTSGDRQVLERQAVALASRCGIVVVLKGHQTLVTDGTRTERNTTGNPGMATGGAGDVLTGVVTAFLCQGLDPWPAARLAVHVHGLAGDLGAACKSETALTARDLVDFLPAAFREMQRVE